MAITQEDIDRRVAAVKPLQPQMGAGEQFLTGLGGAANQVLFGLPEFIARKVQGDELVNKWIQDRQGAWDVGSTVGGVGSFFIPGGALAKGLGMGAKALGAGKIASGLDKAADVIKGAQAIGKSPITQKAIQGVAGALEQGIPRALVETAQTGDIGKAGENLLAGAAMGGGLGAGLGALGKAGKGFIGKHLGEVVEDAKYSTAQAMGLNARAFRGGLQKQAFGNTRMDNRILQKSDDLIDHFNEVGKARGWMSKAGRDDDVANFIKQTSQEYDTAINQALKMPGTHEAAVKGISDAIDEAAQAGLSAGKVYPKGKNPFENVRRDISQYTKDPQAMGRLRNGLEDEIKKLQQRFQTLGADELDRLNTLRYAKQAFEDVLDNAPQGTLVGTRPLREIGKDYAVGKMAKDAALMEKISSLNVGSGGSPTQAKLGIQQMLEGQGPLMAAGGILGASQGDLENDPLGTLAKIAAGSVGGAALTRAMPKLLAKGKAAALPFLEKIAGKFDDGGADLINKLPANVPGQIGAGAASMADLAGGPVAEAAPEMEQEAVEQDVLGAIFNRLDQKWNSTNAQYYGPADPSNPYYAQWARGAIDQAMPGGQLDPIIAGKILGQNKEQADQIAQALAASRAIKQNVAQAGEMGGGILGIGQSPTEQAQLARQLIQGSLGDVGSKAGITQKQVDQAVQQILGGGGTMQEKVQKLMQLQSAYNPQTMAYLSQMGAV